MANEFYELKPGESVENVLRYNNESVLLTDLGTRRCLYQDERLRIKFMVSLFGGKNLSNAQLDIHLAYSNHKVIARYQFIVNAENGILSEIAYLDVAAPGVSMPSKIIITARIAHDIYEIENSWDVWVFPNILMPESDRIICTEELDDSTVRRLDEGADVLLLGTAPFYANPMSFRIALAGRTSGNLATVIEHHPFTEMFEHEGFCEWPFFDLMEQGECLYYPPQTTVPFDPIIEVVSSYKWIRKQAALAEFRVGHGRLIVCTFNLRGKSAVQRWWNAALLHYMQTAQFAPRTKITVQQLMTLVSDGTSAAGNENNNIAANPNDKTMNLHN